MNGDMPKSIAKSFVLHCLLALLFLLPSSKKGDGDKPGKQGKGQFPENAEQRQIIEKSIAVELKEVAKPGIGIKQKPHAFVDRNCGKAAWFGGIGVEIGYAWQQHKFVIDKVYDGYPASAVGIKPGDYIVNFLDDVKGEVGTEVTLNVERDGQTIAFTTKREKICVEEKKP